MQDTQREDPSIVSIRIRNFYRPPQLNRLVLMDKRR